MTNDHKLICNCYDCQNSRKEINDIDNLSGSAGDFIGGKLLSRTKNVTVYSSPNGNPLRTAPKNRDIGTIFSYVQEKNPQGSIWWQLEKGGFVKHGTYFDENYLQLSLDEIKLKKETAINAAAQKRMNANKNPLYNAGKELSGMFSFGNFKVLIYAAIAAVLLGLFLRFKG